MTQGAVLMRIIKDVEIDNLIEGNVWANQWLASRGANSIYFKHPYYVFGTIQGKSVGIRIIPRDHKKENQYEVATIRKKDFDTYKSDFRLHRVEEWYALIARTHRSVSTALKWEYEVDVSYFILLPEALLNREFMIKSAKTVNIGYTPDQKRRWSTEGALYKPFFS